jgi:transcriptional regulator with XRE-family HTH domain
MASEANGVALEFWKRVEQERIRRDWNQEQLWRESGIPPSTLNRLRTGTQPPRTRTVNALADALGIDRIEAAQLAGLIPTPPNVETNRAVRPMTVREAIAEDPVYTDEEKAALLRVADSFYANHRARLAEVLGDEPPAPPDRSDGAQQAI